MRAFYFLSRKPPRSKHRRALFVYGDEFSECKEKACQLPALIRHDPGIGYRPTRVIELMLPVCTRPNALKIWMRA